MTAAIPPGRSGAIGPVLLVQFGQLAIGTIDGRTFRIALMCGQIETSPSQKRERVNLYFREYRARKREAARLAASALHA